MPTCSTQDVNRILVKIRTRAERLDQNQIVSTFVNVGPMMDILNTDDHQIIFGRRGTGKTHALRYLYDVVAEEGQIPIYVDMTKLGSDVSIYNNQSLPVGERATRLLIDVLRTLHDSFLEHALSKDVDLRKFTRVIDNFGEAISKVRIVGTVETEITETEAASSEAQIGASADAKKEGIVASLTASWKRMGRSEQKTQRKSQGREVYHLRFAEVGATFGDICGFFGRTRVWVLLDEWSSIPEDLQPFLADLLRRSFFNVSEATVKIAAIEHRSRFKIDQEGGQYIGLELTSDIRSNLNLDDFLVFDNDRERSITFFTHFLYRHAVAMANERNIPAPKSADELVSLAFTRRDVLEEFVKATEGVPRDAIHIISIAAQKAFGSPISMPNIRQAAHRFYQEDKIGAVDGNETLSRLLRWIIEDVIKQKKTSAFLLEFGRRDGNVDALFDRRMIHVKARNMSSRDNPGLRYYHYKLDYGCYIDLIATKNMPADLEAQEGTFVEDVLVGGIEVPEDDARSYRRAILNLEAFYESEHTFSCGDRNEQGEVINVDSELPATS